MGQKVNPIGFRVGVNNRTWDSRWFAGNKDYAELLHEDIKLRKHILNFANSAGISKVIIERPAKKKARITIHAEKPARLIGKGGESLEKNKKELAKYTQSEIHLNIVEVRKPELDSTLIAKNIAEQLEKRVAFRRAMKRAIQTAMRLGAQGIKVSCSGRLGGAEIARTEWYHEGRVPLHTLRADIDYGTARANTTYGVIGIKVWVFKGEILDQESLTPEKQVTL
jgi:small subunit ribosomal protein S3